MSYGINDENRKIMNNHVDNGFGTIDKRAM